MEVTGFAEGTEIICINHNNYDKASELTHTWISTMPSAKK